jgi:serine/threonine protein phosphatase PrpC
MDADDESLAHVGSRFGMICTRGFKEKVAPCQDDYCIFVDGNAIFIGVFDGHGEMGHYLAASAQNTVTSLVQENFDMFQKDPVNAFKDASKKADAACGDCPGSDNSGTTATLTMITPENIVVGWVGDSHAKVGRTRKRSDLAGNNPPSEWMLESLTKAHRPNDKQERMRIVGAGGRVDEPENPRQDPRVYDLAGTGPGLAMSRSWGDLWGHRLGVSSELDFKSVPTESFEFFCVGSDGVWDMLSEGEVAALIGAAGRDQPQVAADQIKGLAWQRWCAESNDTYVDDISFFVTWLPVVS